MQKNSINNWKLFKVLKTFTESELQDFERFYQKNGNRLRILHLFQYLSKYRNEEEKLSKELIYSTVFEKKYLGNKQQDENLRKRSSELLAHIENFIVFNTFQKKQYIFQKKILLLQHYRNHKLVDRFMELLKKTVKGLGKKRDSEYYYRIFLIERELNILITSMDNRVLEKFIKDYGSFFEKEIKTNFSKNNNDYFRHSSFYQTSKALDKYYLAQQSVYTCQLINSENAKKIECDHISLPIQTIEYLEFLQAEQNHEISLNLWMEALFFLQGKGEHKRFDSFKNLLVKYHEILTKNDLRNLFAFLQNNLRPLLKVNSEYYQMLFDCYQFQEEKGILEGINFTSSILKNITKVAIICGELEWLKAFLERKKREGESFSDGVYKLCLAEFSFALGNLEQSFDYISEIEENASNNRILNSIACRRLQLKIFFEKSDDRFYSIHNSFSSFLSDRREEFNSMGIERLEAERAFLKIIKVLFSKHKEKGKTFMTQFDKNESLNYIKQEVVLAEIISEEVWLLKKIEELTGMNT